MRRVSLPFVVIAILAIFSAELLLAPDASGQTGIEPVPTMPPKATPKPPTMTTDIEPRPVAPPQKPAAAPAAAQPRPQGAVSGPAPAAAPAAAAPAVRAVALPRTGTGFQADTSFTGGRTLAVVALTIAGLGTAALALRRRLPVP